MADPQGTAAIKLNELRCVRCLACYRSCPFDAISLNGTTLSLDAEKCQLCGICASICPIYNIELPYYETKSLINHVKQQKEELQAEALVVMCRGSSPPSCEILDVLKEHDVDKFIPLRVPCVGRVLPEFYLEALLLDIKKIVAVQCDESSCRFKDGSTMNARRIRELQKSLEDLGYGSDVITLIENSSKAVYDTEKCVGCDKCEFICPFGAIEAQPLATPQIDLEVCKGCGACALVCPHLAIQLEGFEYELSSRTIQKYKTEIEGAKLKADSPAILVFCCQWAEFSALDRVKDGILREDVALVEIPCFDGLDPLYVLEAFRSGFDGVLAVVCSDEDCKLKEGRETAERNTSMLEKALEMLNLADRFEVFKTSPRYMGDFDTSLDSFITKVSSLPKVAGE